MPEPEISERMGRLEDRVDKVEEEIAGVKSALALHTVDSKERSDTIIKAVESIRSDYAAQGAQLLTLVGDVVKKSMEHAHKERSSQGALPIKFVESMRPLFTPIASAIAAAISVLVAAWAKSKWGE